MAFRRLGVGPCSTAIRFIRTFGGPLQVMSITPVLLPVGGDLNESFGKRDHLNVAGKLYVLLLGTDIDVMFLSGGSAC